MNEEIRKSAQVVAFFRMKMASNMPGTMRMLKLAYFADKLNMQRYGWPLLEDERRMLPKGPVLQQMYDRLKLDAGPLPAEWLEFAEASYDTITLDNLDELSDSEIEVLTDTWETHQDKSGEDFSHYSHRPEVCPEWTFKTTGVKTVTVEEALRINRPSDGAERFKEYQTQKALAAVFS